MDTALHMMLPVVGMLTTLTTLTTVRVGALTLALGISCGARPSLVTRIGAMGLRSGAIGNGVCMVFFVLLEVKIVRPIIVLLMSCPLVAAGRGGVGQRFTGSMVLVGMMIRVSMRSTLASTRVLGLSKGVRPTISVRGVTR